MGFHGTFSSSIVTAVLSFFVLSVTSPSIAAGGAGCGNGVVEAGEECDPGSTLGSPECNTACERTEFEPPGLPFGAPMSTLTEDGESAPGIFSRGLQCRPADVRNGARLLEPVVVRYRIYLCHNALGIDSFTPEEVRAAMARSSAEFAKGGVVLEEESLVRFSEKDCLVPLEDTGWSDALVDDTPPGVLAITFVTGIGSATSQFSVGGFCYFFGPICVNAGAYDTLVIHELGHFFGLAHTFECAWGSETPATCSTTGDMVCDTPPDRGPAGVRRIARCDDGSFLNGSCSGSCGAKVCTDGSTPDGYDWMSYYHCADGHFTNEQRDFMRCTLDHEMRTYNSGSFDSTTTTSTTLPGAECGDINEDGLLTASDALGVLRSGVGVIECALWQCDYDGSGNISAVDALAVLKAAIGIGTPGKCPAQF